MGFDVAGAGSARFLGISILTALLAGCGGGSASSSGASTSVVTSAAGSSNATASVALSASEYTVAPASSAVVTIYRSGSSAGTATVGYSTVNGSAVAGTDYSATTGTVSWADGDSTAKTVSVRVAGAASGKQFVLSLTSVEGNADFGSPSTATVMVSASAANSNSGAYAGTSSGSAVNPGTGSVTLSWNAPTENTNGTALTNLAGYVIYYGTSANAMTQSITVNTVGLLSYVVGNLGSGTWYFDVVAINASGAQSGPSSIVSTTI
jgi:hypothetical protein